MQTDNIFAQHIAEYLKPEEVAIVMRRGPKGVAEFKIVISDKEHTDLQVEADTYVIYATAVGLASMVAENGMVAFLRGAKIIDAEASTRNG